jgi:hypothetical protein
MARGCPGPLPQEYSNIPLGFLQSGMFHLTQVETTSDYQRNGALLIGPYMIAAIHLTKINDTTNAYPRLLFHGDITLPDTFIPGLWRFGGKMESVAAQTVSSAPGINFINA